MDMKSWCIYTKEYYLDIKEHIGLSSNKVDELRAYYTEWSKSERGNQTNFTYIYIYMVSRKMVLMNPYAGQQWIHRHI